MASRRVIIGYYILEADGAEEVAETACFPKIWPKMNLSLHHPT